MVQQLIDPLYLFASCHGWWLSWALHSLVSGDYQTAKNHRKITSCYVKFSIFNSVALLVALLSTAISAVSATRNGKIFSRTCRLFEPTGWQCEVTSLSSLWHPCHATITSKSLHPNHTKFSVPPIIFSTLFMSMSPTFPSRGHWYMSKDQVYQPFWPTGRPPAPASRPVAFLSPCRPGPVGFSSCQPHQQKKNVCIVVAWPGLDQAGRTAGVVSPAHLI